MSMIKNFYFNKTLTQSMNYVNISVLHKTGKDPLNCSSYRPISLLDSDYKIIMKLLANRLESVLPKVIHPDKSGFIKGRHATDNTRRLLNIINHLNINRKPSLFLSLDTEKAFDRVEWPFLFPVLHSLNVGHNFMMD